MESSKKLLYFGGGAIALIGGYKLWQLYQFGESVQTKISVGKFSLSLRGMTIAMNITVVNPTREDVNLRTPYVRFFRKSDPSGNIAISDPSPAVTTIPARGQSVINGITITVGWQALLSIVSVKNARKAITDVFTSSKSDGDKYTALSSLVKEPIYVEYSTSANGVPYKAAPALILGHEAAPVAGGIPPTQSVTSGHRVLRPRRSEWEAMIPQPDWNDTTVTKRGSIETTVSKMQQLTRQNSWQVRDIAKTLRGADDSQTLRNVWEFTYYHIQYELDGKDEDGNELEQLRTPARTWHERKADCDCFTIFCGAILLELGIPYSIRIAQYDINGVPTWRHVYIYVPSQRTVLDAVLSPFGYEEPYIQVKDYPMELQVLSGFAGATADPLAVVKAEIEKQLSYAESAPAAYSTEYDAYTFRRYARYALDNWNNPQKRDAALAELAQRESDYNTRLAGFGLGKGKPGRKFFTAVKNTVEKVKDNVTQGDGKLSVKDAIRTVTVVANAGTAVIRQGVKLAMHANLFQIAQKLAPAYFDPNPSSAQQTAARRVEKIFSNIGGDKDSLIKAIKQGRGAKKAGFKGFGEPVTAAVVIASAPVILEILNELKKAGLIDKVPSIDDIKKSFGKQDTGTDGGKETATTPTDKTVTTDDGDNAAQQSPSTSGGTPSTLLIVGGLAAAALVGYSMMDGGKAKSEKLGATKAVKPKKKATRESKPTTPPTKKTPRKQGLILN